jgi:hypothetical protein
MCSLFQALLPEQVQAKVSDDTPAKIIEKGVVFMKQVFMSPEGLKIILGFLAVLLDCIILGNTIAGVPGKGNTYFERI